MSIGSKIAAFFTQKKIDEQTLQMLEDTLISSDIGVAKTAELIAKIKNQKWGKEFSFEEIKSFLESELSQTLKNTEKKLDFEQKKPMVILFAGVNGSGKTTTIGKIAYQLSLINKKIMLVCRRYF
jgi:fused signal recognition particle receptor